MATTHESISQPGLQMLQSANKVPIFRRTSSARPLSDATEILDTDLESDYEDDDQENSPRWSVGSVGGLSMQGLDLTDCEMTQPAADSVTTASTPRDVPTPDSGSLSAFHFHIDEKPVRGPSGPHLFRSYIDSEELNTSLEVDFFLAKTPTKPLFDRASTLEPKRKDAPLPDSAKDIPPETQLSSINAAVSELDEAEVRSWAPPDVVRWMQKAGLDDSIVEKFFINDISGAILLELQAEDLKELDIKSFGKRHRLMHSIQHLRNSVMIATGDTQIPHANSSPESDPVSSESPSTSDCTPIQSESDKKDETKRKHRRHRRCHHGSEDVTPGDSVSIVAIEQLLPKPHRCSKGEACHKWQKQQRKIARFTKDLPLEAIDLIETPSETETQNPPLTRKHLPGQEPMLTPSIVASSDVLGPEPAPHFQLSEEKLSEVRPRDPQENVRQFLSLQHLNRLQPVTDSGTTSKVLDASPDVDSLDSTKTTASLSENLRHLPKLTIPVTQTTIQLGSLSANLSAQRTITPSILRKKPNFNHTNVDLPPQAPNLKPCTYGQDVSPADGGLSPSDFYRTHEIYRQQTPASEFDVPLTAIPTGPVARDTSQSVPPNMRFGHSLHAMSDPITRPMSTKAGNRRRHPSFNISSTPALKPVNETVLPIDTLEDLETTPRIPTHTPGDAVHTGWMKKRKTTRLLRHEWEDHHFTLKGTRLAMYEDAETSTRDSKALEYIDVDDYAVACSSLASSSKLTAAFKKTVLKRTDASQDGAAFAFSLIPAPNGCSTTQDRKAFFSSGKSHHFAVKTRDERIDWMRELMLAKALKRGRDSGESVHINGYAF